MKKIYTSILCITLLAPIAVQAEICTDFDENFNVIEFDCAEGINAARKRIAAEAQKKEQQERATAEAAARAEREKQAKLEAEREKQAKLEAERLAEELSKAKEKLKAEKEKRATLEKERFLSDLQKTGGFKVVAGLGVSGWVGPRVPADAFQGQSMDGWTIWNANYDASGLSVTASLGARYYFNQSNKWFVQMSLSLSDGYEHDVQINSAQPPYGVYSDALKLSEIKTENFISIDATVGVLTWDKTYLYGRLGVGTMDYDIGDYERLVPDFNTDVSAFIFGFGVEYNVWKQVFAYADMNVLVGDFLLGDSFLKFDLGVKYQF